MVLDNVCSYNERGYLTDETEPYYGEALAIVRAGFGQSIRLRAVGETENCRMEIVISVIGE